MPMSRDIARAFTFGVVLHDGTFPAPKQEPAAGMTDAERAKIREMFAPTEDNE